MRKIQMSFTIESFGDCAEDGKHQIVRGYNDANNIHEILKEEIKALNELYDKESTYDELIEKIESFDNIRSDVTEVYK